VQVSVVDSTGLATAVAPQVYTYVGGMPVVSAVSPGSGPSTGGNTVIISGRLFLGATGVKFGTVAAKSFTVVSASQITAVAPAGVDGTMVDVQVIGPSGTSTASDATTYVYGAPVVTALSPAAGPAAGGNIVVMTGVGLFGATKVMFGSTEAPGLNSTTATELRVTAPAGADGTTVDVTVIGPGGTSLATAATRYAYGAPLVKSVTPSLGPATGVTPVTILGSGFTGLSGASAVRFGTRNALSYTVVSDTMIFALSPPGTGGQSVAVTVTNPAGLSPATAYFLYIG
jgi:hypothetical protein